MMRHDHGDGAAMAGGFQAFVRHLNRKVIPKQELNKYIRVGYWDSGLLAILSESVKQSKERDDAVPSTEELKLRRRKKGRRYEVAKEAPLNPRGRIPFRLGNSCLSRRYESQVN